MAWFTMDGFPVLLCTITLGALLPVTQGYTHADEETLRTSLFTGYNTDVRPETPIDVTLTMTLMSLNYLDIGAQEMCVNMVLVSAWTDSRLMWDPSAHNNIQTLVVRHGGVWLPTIVIENTIDNAGLFGNDEEAPVRVDSSGFVVWISPAFTRVSCNMDVTYYPFDTQACVISVYGWAQDLTEMNITVASQPWRLKEFRENGEWSLGETSVSEYLATDGVNTFKTLYFRLSFKRKWQFPFLSIIVPGILNSILMCAVFKLPCEPVDKLSYSLTVLLSYYVLLTYVSDTLPATSTHIALLQSYLTFVMLAGTLSNLLTVVVVAVYNYDHDRPIPPWVAYTYYRVSTFLVCRTGSCQQISSLCADCKRHNRRRRKTTPTQPRKSGLKSSLNVDEKSKSSSSTSALSSSSSSFSFSSPPKVNIESQTRAMQETQTDGNRRGVTAKKFDGQPRIAELPTVHDISITSADYSDSGVENSSTATIENETKAIPNSTKASRRLKHKTHNTHLNTSVHNTHLNTSVHNTHLNTSEADLCKCRNTSDPFILFNQLKRDAAQQGVKQQRCESCGKFVKVEAFNKASGNRNTDNNGDDDGDDDDDVGGGGGWKEEFYDEMKELTWKMVAERMDAVFFRVFGGGITLFTVLLLILLLAQY